MHEVDLIWRLLLALALSSIVGVEREMRQKSAGLRTHALVGTGAALFMLVSSYGFADTLGQNVTLDPSRVAAQIVSGIGFIGGGLIFVHRSDVRGLTTAASVWVTAAIGMAAGGDLPLLALTTTVIYLIVAYAYPVFTARLPSYRGAPSKLRLTYSDGRGVLRRLLAECSAHGFAVSDLNVEHTDGDGEDRTVTVRLEVRGGGSVADLVGDLDSDDGVIAVVAADVDVLQEV